MCPRLISQDHPLRATARYMRKKAEHHLQYLQDRVDRGPGISLQIPGLSGPNPRSSSIRLGSHGADRGEGESGPGGMDEDEDAAGEDEDGDGEVERDGLLKVGGEKRAGEY